MVQQADSIQTDAALEAESQQQVLRQHSSQLTPKEVLSWLPKSSDFERNPFFLPVSGAR